MDENSILSLLGDLRAFLEPRWREWREESRGRALPGGVAVSHSMCRFSACFLAMALERATGEEWLVVGGEPCAGAAGGMLGTDGRWHAHYWVVDSCWDRLADVTADQFGHPAVILATEDDPRYAASYECHEVEEHLQWVAARAATWLEEALAEIPALRGGGKEALSRIPFGQ